MPTHLTIDAVTNPNGYLDQVYQELPTLFAHGGTQEHVDAVFGGIDVALTRALGVSLGATVGLRLFARPWGWAPDTTERIDADSLIADGASPDFDDADFSAGDLYGRIFVPADAGWRRWSPTSGPAPLPADGHLRVVVAFQRRDIEGVTVCHLREVFGRDNSLSDPLYKAAVRLAPASPTEAAHLMDTLRALLTTKEAA